MKAEILKAVPAAGKTKAILDHIRRNKRKSIVASISCQLSQQSFDFYANNGGTDAVIIDSEHTKGKSVNVTIEECLKQYRVLFITHAALLQFNDFELMRGFDLYIDEVPEFVELHQMKFTANLDVIKQYCDVDSQGIMTLQESERARLEKMAFDGMNQKDVVAESLFKLIKALLVGTPVILKRTEVYFIEDNSSNKWDVFNKITIACANFEETFTGVILKEFCGWEFKSSSLTKKLDFMQYPNSERVEIIPLYEGHWSRYASDKVIDDSTLYGKMKDMVDDITGGVPYIYTTNSYRAALKSGQQIGYNPHGLNQYMSHTTAVALFSYNPHGWQVRLLRDLEASKNLKQDSLVAAFTVSKYLEPVFQLCLRTDIRNQFSTDQVRLIVPDMRAAEYLKTRYLTHARINTGLMIREITERKERAVEQVPRKTYKTISNMFSMTKDEKMKFKYWKRMNGHKNLDVLNQQHVMMVKTWLDSIRGSN